MAKCLVTGASGFIGAHLVRALVARGDEVTCLVRKSSKLSMIDGLPIKYAHGDLTDEKSLEAAVASQDVVFHLAGLIKSLTPAAMYDVNAEGTARVVRACAAQPNPPVAILMSSLAAAGPTPNGSPVEPAEEPRPVSNYGKSKLAGEIAAAKLAQETPVTILRPPIVIGEGDTTALELFHTVRAFRIHPVPGFRPQRFSLIHATDLADAAIRAADRGKRLVPLRHDSEDRNKFETYPQAAGQGIYYPADKEIPTYAEIGTLVAKALGRKGVMVIPTAKPALWTAAAIGELAGRLIRKPLTLNLDKVREATAGNWVCSPRSAEEELGFRPGASLEDRFRQTTRWYVEQGWL